MCRRILLSLMLPLAAVGAYFLRTLQLSLSATISPYTIGLWGLLGGVLLLTALLVIPEKKGDRLSQLRAVPVAIALQGGGALLTVVSGAWQLYELYPMLRSFATLSAAALILAGIGLFGGMKACEGGEKNVGALLLLPLLASVLQVILVYWETSNNPALREYDMRLLFLGAAAISIALLTDFVFFVGRRRLLLVFLALTIVLAGAAAPTVESLARLGAIIGTAIAAFGFFLSLLFGFDRNDHPHYELVDDPFSTGRIRAAAQDETPTADTVSAAPTEEIAPLDPPVKPAPAAAPTPADSDDFDLARVDQLLLELELDDGTRKK